MSKDISFVASMNTAPMDKAGKEVQKQSLQRLRATVSNIRRVSEMTVAAMMAIGIAVDQSYMLGIMVGVRAVELAISVQALMTTTSFGLNWATGQAFAQAGAIALLLITIHNMERGRMESARLFRSAAMFAQLATWKG